MALPGWEPKDVTLEVNNQVLSVKGEKTEESSDSRKHLMREIADGRFVRIFKLPTIVDHDKASATYKNGLLTISLPKRAEPRPVRESQGTQTLPIPTSCHHGQKKKANDDSPIGD